MSEGLFLLTTILTNMPCNITKNRYLRHRWVDEIFPYLIYLIYIITQYANYWRTFEVVILCIIKLINAILMALPVVYVTTSPL